MFHTGSSFGARLAALSASLILLTALAGAVAQAQTPPAPPTPPKAPTLDEVKAGITRGDTRKYECAYVLPKGEKPAEAFCPPDAGKASKVLTPENGDIVVVIKSADYFAAMQAMNNQPLQVSLNGLNMAGSARHTGWVQSGELVKLSFGVTQIDTQEARAFWSATYQRVGFGQLTPLYVTLGWPANPSYFSPGTPSGLPDILYVTSDLRTAIASGLGLSILGIFLWALFGSDIFRVGRQLDTGGRQPYSFSRVQWGVWTTFTVSAAVFLWAVFGIFPAMTNTVLALSGVSTLAATTSFFMDSGSPQVPEKSVNLWMDLLSGSNDTTAQAHRFQALIVNLVMLVAAVYYVFQHLGYPTFDPTWLAMLGISDAGQLAGKQLLENKGTGQPADLPLATVPPGPTGAAPAAPGAVPAVTLPPGPPTPG